MRPQQLLLSAAGVRCCRHIGRGGAENAGPENAGPENEGPSRNVASLCN